MNNSIQEIIDHALKGGEFLFWDNDSNLDYQGELCDITFSFGKLYYKPNHKAAALFPEIEIIKPERKLKDPVSLMKALVDGGWKPDNNGAFKHAIKPTFVHRMWRDCGKEESKWFLGWTVDPSWIEEE